MSDLISRAAQYATQAHARIDQRRKYSNQPYDVHLRQVAALVAEVSDDAEMIAAAWLHDTVEDTPATFRDIEEAFGPDVARLVAELTDVSRPGDGNRAARKAIDRDHLAGASDRAKTVKLADLIDNCRDICRHDPRFARVFADEMAALLEVLGGGEPRLMNRARKTLQRCRDRLLSPPKLADDTAPAGPALWAEEGARHQRHALKLFTTAFKAADIADPLPSFDAQVAAPEVAESMAAAGWAVAGVREGGLVRGYVRDNELGDGSCGAYRRDFLRVQIVAADASLSLVIHVLTRHGSCFVESLGEVTAVIRRAHVQRPVVRMWLFGMITLIELTVTERIRRYFPDGEWFEQVSEGRAGQARKLQTERGRRGQDVDLLDCLQLGDKMQILLRDDVHLAWMGFESRRVAKHVAKSFESLRNNLAHTQDIVSSDWPQIVRMTQRIELIAAGEDD